jgi:hypothetical protein
LNATGKKFIIISLGLLILFISPTVNAITENFNMNLTIASFYYVNSTSPGNGSIGASVNTAISVIFNKPMNASSFNESTFIVKDSSNNTVSGALTYNNSTYTAVFIPSARLSYSTNYNVTLSGVRDIAGSIYPNYSWAFSTVAYSESSSPQAPTSRVVIGPKLSCNESWECTNWSSCFDSNRTRICSDKNKCGTEKYRPVTTWECNSSKEIKGALFDINAEITEEITGKELMATITLINFGEPGLVNATVNYVIMDSAGWIFYNETEIVPVETQREFIKSFNTSALKNGQYSLLINLSYEGQKEPARTEKVFVISRPEEGNIPTELFASIPIVIIAVYLIYKLVKRRRSSLAGRA